MAVPPELYTSFDPIAEEWDRLADATGAAPFLRPGWLSAWWDAFGAGTLRIAALRDGGELVAVLPLVQRGGGLHAPVNWHTPEFGATARDRDAERALYDVVLADRPAYASLRFLTAEDDAPVEALRRGRYRTEVRTLQESPYLPLDAGWDALHKPREKDFARLWRRLDERGAVEFEEHDGTTDLDTRLTEGLAIEGSGWKTEQGTAIISRPDTLAFYTEVAHWAASRGILRMFFLRSAGRPVAFELGLEDCGSFYFLKGGYDPEFKKQGPGLLIMREIIKWSCEHGLSTFEFLGAPDSQKLEWTSHLRRRVAVEAFAPGARGVAARAAFTARPAARRLVAAVRRRAA